MPKSLRLFVALLLTGAAAAVWWRAEPPEPASSTSGQSTSSTSEQSTSSVAIAPAASRDTSEPTAVAQTPAPTPAEETKPPLFVEGLEATLRADAEGRLIMDNETLRALEMLTTMSPRELALRRQRLVEQLPSVAASQALDLLPKVAQYRTAARQMFPAGTTPTTVPEALGMLDAVHRLRVSYLGEDATRAFFARDEGMARKLIESAGAPDGERTAAEQSKRTATMLGMAFSFFIMPRKPPTAIGQQDSSD